MRLDPGGGTQLALAVCYEAAGKVASAWGAFHTALALAERDRRSDRADIARARLAALRPRLSTLRIDVGAVAASAPGFRVLRDGIELGRASLGLAVPFDPGRYRIRVEAPGFEPWEQLVSLERDGAQQRLVVPALVPSRAPEGRAAPERGASPGAPEPGSLDSGSSRPLFGYLLGGAGLAALVTGSVFGVKALGSRSELRELCPRDPCDESSRAAYEAKYNEWTRQSTATNVGVGIGILAVSAGAYLWWSAPRGGGGAAVTPDRSKLSTVGFGPRRRGALLSWGGVF